MYLKSFINIHDLSAEDNFLKLLSKTDSDIRKIILIRSCQLDLLPYYLSQRFQHIEAEEYIVNGVADMPAAMKHPASEYAFQIVQVPLAAVVQLQPWLSLDMMDGQSCQRFFDECVDRLELFLGCRLKWADDFGVPAFVMNFLTPQASLLGRAQSRYSLQNSIYFVEKLNEVLGRLIAARKSVYLLDADNISRVIGKRHLQDDTIHNTTHGGLITDYGHAEDQDRLHPISAPSAQFEFHPIAQVRALWDEAVALYRTIQQVDSIKIVIVDLDDTLWRGIPAEGQDDNIDRIGGWPAGVLEALVILKRRGVLLGIISKNDFERTAANWQRIYGHYCSWDIFTFKEIGWNSKSEGMEAILKKANLLPRNALFIDDNPVERAAMQAAFPDIRVLGDNQYLVRTALLHSSETQVAHITDESAKRAEMMTAQVAREESRAKLTKEEFLASLDVQIQESRITSADDFLYARCFELINKTNQFNTTGRRWSQAEMHSFLQAGGVLHAFKVSDKFSDYGIVAIAVVLNGVIEQFVMSCRVIGLEVESRSLRSVFDQIGAPVSARLIDTGANGLVTHLWANLGFEKTAEDSWTLAQAA